MGTSKKILIIDDNGFNGYTLGHLCLELASVLGWKVTWLRVTASKPQPTEGLSSAITYHTIDNQNEAAAAIKQHMGDDLIVFYDLQLLGVQEPINAASSLITNALKDLMDDGKRRMLVNVHSASEQDSKMIAELLDPLMKRVLFKDTVTRNLETALKVVDGTLEKWNSLYARQFLDAEGFISAMEKMTHEQIQDYPSFIKTRKAKEGLTEGQLKKKYLDPAKVLMNYLGMDTVEFERNFCTASKSLKGEVIEALKSISGLYSLEDQVMGRRQLSWSGAWLLALGVFRSLKSRDKWKEIFDVADLRGGEEDGAQYKWPNMHAMQRPERRKETVRGFAEMTRILFTKKGAPSESVLEKVELTSKKEQTNKFSFRLSFPCVAGGVEQHESLLGRVVEHVDLALMVAEGSAVAATGKNRETSRAIWRFFLSASICDLKDGVEDRGYGMAGGFSPMNILSIEKNTKTEVLWLY